MGDQQENLARRLKVAIIGKAPSSRDLAPYDDDDFEIWTLSNLVQLEEVPRWDRHFEIHELSTFHARRKPYWEWLKQSHGKPIYLRDRHPDVPDGVAYPKKAICDHFGRYFTNTVSWMIALAIAEGAEAIHVYGVDMAQTEEYGEQRPSCEFFLGWAAGAGIEIFVPPQADMLKCRLLYGFETDSGEMREKWKARTKELEQRLNAKISERDRMAAEAAYLNGALEAQHYYAQWL